MIQAIFRTFYAIVTYRDALNLSLSGIYAFLLSFNHTQIASMDAPEKNPGKSFNLEDGAHFLQIFPPYDQGTSQPPGQQQVHFQGSYAAVDQLPVRQHNTPFDGEDPDNVAIMQHAVVEAAIRIVRNQPPCLFDPPPGEQDGASLTDDAPPWEHLGLSCRPDWWHYWEERHNEAAAAGQPSAAALLLGAEAAAAAARAAAQLPLDPLMFPSLATLQERGRAQDAEDGIMPDHGDDEAPPPGG